MARMLRVMASARGRTPRIGICKTNIVVRIAAPYHRYSLKRGPAAQSLRPPVASSATTKRIAVPKEASNTRHRAPATPNLAQNGARAAFGRRAYDNCLRARARTLHIVVPRAFLAMHQVMSALRLAACL